MICCNNKTKLRYNYRFVNEELVEIWDGEDYIKEVPYDDWFKEYDIIDKWRCLSPELNIIKYRPDVTVEDVED